MRRLLVMSVISSLCLGQGAGLTFAQNVSPVVTKSAAAPTAANGTSTPVPPANASHPMSEKASLIVTKEYIIGPEDLLEITVWRNQDLSKTVAVRPDGRISMPLIGDVAAVGKTPSQLTEEIASKLKEFKENPSVAIVVKEVNSYAVYVLGEIESENRRAASSMSIVMLAIAFGLVVLVDFLQRKRDDR